MIEVDVLKNQLVITANEQITSGSVNVYYVHFHFTSHWDGLEKIAVFRTPDTTINVPIENNVAVVPWEVTTTPGYPIRLGVYGIKTMEVILPTIWTTLTTVVEGVFIGDAESGDHTPDIYDSILAKIEEFLNELDLLKEDLEALEDDLPTDDEIFMIINRYLKIYPPEVSNQTIINAVSNYFEENPIQGITREEVQEMIDSSVGKAILDGY